MTCRTLGRRRWRKDPEAPRWRTPVTLFWKRGIEPVAHVPHGEDAATFRTQLVSEAADMDVDGARLEICVLAGAPHRFEQGIAAEDPSIGHQQCPEQAEFLRCQMNRFSP